MKLPIRTPSAPPERFAQNFSTFLFEPERSAIPAIVATMPSAKNTVATYTNIATPPISLLLTPSFLTVSDTFATHFSRSNEDTFSPKASNIGKKGTAAMTHMKISMITLTPIVSGLGCPFILFGAYGEATTGWPVGAPIGGCWYCWFIGCGGTCCCGYCCCGKSTCPCGCWYCGYIGC